MIVCGRSGTEKGCSRRGWYSSSLMSEVRIREVRPAVNASGGKVGRVNVWRGIWAARASETGTAWADSRAVALEERKVEGEVEVDIV